MTCMTCTQIRPVRLAASSNQPDPLSDKRCLDSFLSGPGRFRPSRSGTCFSQSTYKLLLMATAAVTVDQERAGGV